VSDFLGGGGAEIEARAKAIFDVLLSQSECVVLFDEIDNFLLDRDSDRYAKQESVFQFMTPGMLTKLNDLRRARRLIFVVATNYENRIDAAIKRPGRIDQKYLVLPPGSMARQRIIRKLLTKKPSGSSMKVEGISEADWRKLETASLFLGFKDIEGAIDTEKAPASVDKLCGALKERPRTTSLRMYRSKFNEMGNEQLPYEEFFCLLAMALKCEDRIFVDAAAVAAVKNSLVSEAKIEEAVHSHAPYLSPEDIRLVVAELASAGQEGAV
jgi:SpoVK/Ycf46/Vps4 family AAA+-type ATPase